MKSIFTEGIEEEESLLKGPEDQRRRKRLSHSGWGKVPLYREYSKVRRKTGAVTLELRGKGILSHGKIKSLPL